MTNKSQALLEAMAAGDVDTVLAGTEYETENGISETFLEGDAVENAARVTALLAVLEDVGDALVRAREDMTTWLSYTSGYFIDKHPGADDLQAIDNALATITKDKEACK